MTKSLFSRRSNALSPRRGFTLLEILTSITLALTLMYAVARIFSNVGGSMNETMSSMEMSNALRNAKNRLTADLEATSVTLAPPRNSRRDEGFFCYVEGLGDPYQRVQLTGVRATSDVALDTERSLDMEQSIADSTAGDFDDILSFTAKAPDGRPFRGRFIEPTYDANGDINGGFPTVIESEYAEIVWFLRGTTLYRRVFPLVSNQRLQDSFLAAEKYYSVDFAANLRQGYGFYRVYDVSVHLGTNGVLVANTLGDLSNRANRYFYWNSCGLHLSDVPDPNAPNCTDSLYALNPHGANGAWYWLRMPTLQESAAPNFRAGAPFGVSDFARDKPIAQAERAARTLDGFDAGNSVKSSTHWPGFAQLLNLDDAVSALDAPQFDFWLTPNPWLGQSGKLASLYLGSSVQVDAVDAETGDLLLARGDIETPYNTARALDFDLPLVYNQDVVLTNVLSFDVKAWDENQDRYVNLGENGGGNPDDLTSYGYYNFPSPDAASSQTDLLLPSVYDTWTEQYQRDLYIYDDYHAAQNGSYVRKADGSIADIPLDATPTSAQLRDYPPPYNVPLKSVQVEIRVFDPRSKAIRQATFVVDLSKN